MQRRIFAVWGVAGCGKTTTLKLIAREILRNYFGSIPDIPLEPLPDGDMTTIIDVPTVRGIVRIGITSKGDPNTDLISRLEELVSKRCEIIFCATRTSGTTVQDVEFIERKHKFRATWVTNYQTGYVDERAFMNQKSAEHLVSLMRFVCLI